MKTTFRRSSLKGFTLIELIIVIGILATLASIAYPAYNAVQRSAAQTAARQVCNNIVDGVGKFYNDYSRMPVDESNPIAEPDAKDQIHLQTEADKDARMIEILTNREPEDAENRVNTNRDTYLTSEEQDQPKDGLYVKDDEIMGFFDPWNHGYYVVLTYEKGKGCIDPTTGKNVRGKQCLVYSTGADGLGAGDIAPATEKKKAGKKPKHGAAAAAVTPSDEEAEEELEDNVYSWKKNK